MSSVERVIAALSPGESPKRAGAGYLLRCPAHDDRSPSLSVGQGARSVVLHCHAGCSQAAVREALASLGVPGPALFDDFRGEGRHTKSPTPIAAPRIASAGVAGPGRIVATYDYTDKSGRLLYQVVRYEPKDFRQRRPDGRGGWSWSLGDVRRVPYRLRDVLTADPEGVVFVTEGEKDAEALAALDLVATTNPGGSGNGALWSSADFREPFRDRSAVLLPDNDEAGRKHMQAVARNLRGIAESVCIVELPGLAPKGDVSDWLALGGTVDQLQTLVDAAPEWAQSAQSGNANAPVFDGAPPPGEEDLREPTDDNAPAVRFGAADVTRAEGSARPAHVVRMSTVTAKDVEWLWPGRLPVGMVSVLDGPPGMGKSTVVIDLVARLTTGRPFPNEAGSRHPADVVLLGHEDSPEYTIRPRLDAAGADPSRVHLLMGIGGRPPRLPDDGAEIEGVVRDTGARLLVVDPISAYIGGADMHRDNDVRGALAPLAALAESTGAAVLLLRHLRKSGGTDAMSRGLGSVAIIALARAGLMLLPDPDDAEAKILTWSKMSVAPLPASLRWRLRTDTEAPRIAWEGVCDLTANDILSRQDRAWAGGEDERTALDEAGGFLRDALAAGSVPATEIIRDAKQAGISEKTLRRAMKGVGAQARKQSFSGKWEWSLAKVATDTAWASSGDDSANASSKSATDTGLDQGGQHGQPPDARAGMANMAALGDADADELTIDLAGVGT